MSCSYGRRRLYRQRIHFVRGGDNTPFIFTFPSTRHSVENVVGCSSRLYALYTHHTNALLCTGMFRLEGCRASTQISKVIAQIL